MASLLCFRTYSLDTLLSSLNIADNFSLSPNIHFLPGRFKSFSYNGIRLANKMQQPRGAAETSWKILWLSSADHYFPESRP